MLLDNLIPTVVACENGLLILVFLFFSFLFAGSRQYHRQEGRNRQAFQRRGKYIFTVVLESSIPFGIEFLMGG